MSAPDRSLVSPGFLFALWNHATLGQSRRAVVEDAASEEPPVLLFVVEGGLNDTEWELPQAA